MDNGGILTFGEDKNGVCDVPPPLKYNPRDPTREMPAIIGVMAGTEFSAAFTEAGVLFVWGMVDFEVRLEEYIDIDPETTSIKSICIIPSHEDVEDPFTAMVLDNSGKLHFMGETNPYLRIESTAHLIPPDFLLSPDETNQQKIIAISCSTILTAENQTHAAALMSDGTLHAWGNNQHRQCTESCLEHCLTFAPDF